MNEFEHGIARNAKIVERMSASYIADACKNCQADNAKLIRVLKELIIPGVLYSNKINKHIIEAENNDPNYFRGIPEVLHECGIESGIAPDGNLIVTCIQVKWVDMK